MSADRASRVVAVGRFDGVHRGHQHLLAEARHLGQGLPVVAYTFPLRGPSLLTLAAKARLLQDHADEVLVVPWDHVLDMSAEAFVRDELVGLLGAAAVVAGPGHRFGRDRTGDLAALRRLARPHLLAVHGVEPLRVAGDVVSARRIRDLVAAGAVDQAAALLGRSAWLAGAPTPGLKLARRLGYPTVNLDLAPELVRPRPGVYAAWAQWAGGEGKALFYIGDRPTFPGLPPSAEVHLFRPPGGAVEGPVEVHLARFIRPDQRFPSEGALMEQIAQDRKKGGKALAGTDPPRRLLHGEELRTPGGGP